MKLFVFLTLCLVASAAAQAPIRGPTPTTDGPMVTMDGPMPMPRGDEPMMEVTSHAAGSDMSPMAAAMGGMGKMEGHDENHVEAGSAAFWERLGQVSLYVLNHGMMDEAALHKWFMKNADNHETLMWIVEHFWNPSMSHERNDRVAYGSYDAILRVLQWAEWNVQRGVVDRALALKLIWQNYHNLDYIHFIANYYWTPAMAFVQLNTAPLPASPAAPVAQPSDFTGSWVRRFSTQDVEIRFDCASTSSANPSFCTVMAGGAAIGNLRHVLAATYFFTGVDNTVEEWTRTNNNLFVISPKPTTPARFTPIVYRSGFAPANVAQTIAEAPTTFSGSWRRVFNDGNSAMITLTCDASSVCAVALSPAGTNLGTLTPVSFSSFTFTAAGQTGTTETWTVDSMSRFNIADGGSVQRQ